MENAEKSKDPNISYQSVILFSFTSYIMRAGCMHFESNGADVVYSVDSIDELCMLHVRENFHKGGMCFDMSMAAKFME